MEVKREANGMVRKSRPRKWLNPVEFASWIRPVSIIKIKLKLDYFAGLVGRAVMGGGG